MLFIIIFFFEPVKKHIVDTGTTWWKLEAWQLVVVHIACVDPVCLAWMHVTNLAYEDKIHIK